MKLVICGVPFSLEHKPFPLSYEAERQVSGKAAKQKNQARSEMDVSTCLGRTFRCSYSNRNRGQGREDEGLAEHVDATQAVNTLRTWRLKIHKVTKERFTGMRIRFPTLRDTRES